MNAITALVLANKHTDETVLGGGAIKGKNCIISNISKVDGVTEVTFSWTLDDGTVRTQTISVKDGVDGYTPVKDVDYFDGEKGDRGATGIGIVSVTKSGSSGLVDTYTITFSDGAESTFTVVNGANITKLSELENDEEFIKATTINLVNYYLKDEVYNKSKIDELLRNVGAGLSVKIVSTLPTEEISGTTIYLINTSGSNYNQYMYIDGDWANLGSTAVDMSSYYNKTQIDNKLEDYVTANRLTNKLDDYVAKANLSKVGKTNSYNDLDDLPEIPSTEGFMKGRQMLGVTDLNDCLTEGTFTISANSANLPNVQIYGTYADLEVLAIETVVNQQVRIVVGANLEPMLWERAKVNGNWTEWVHALSNKYATSEIVDSDRLLPTSKAVYDEVERIDGDITTLNDSLVDIDAKVDELDKKFSAQYIPSDKHDLNELIDDGVYTFYNESIENAPLYFGVGKLSYGNVEVIRFTDNSRVKQTYQLANNGKIYTFTRYRSAEGVWNDWQELATMDKVGTITNLTLPNYTSKNTNGNFTNELLGSFFLQAGKYMVVVQSLINDVNPFGSDGVIGLLIDRHQTRTAPAEGRDNAVQLSCILNLTEAKQMSLYYIGHYKCNVTNIFIDVMKIG